MFISSSEKPQGLTDSLTQPEIENVANDFVDRLRGRYGSIQEEGRPTPQAEGPHVRPSETSTPKPYQEA